MDKLLIKGGYKLRGVVKVSGAKNVAMKVVLAGLLTDKPIFIKNVPLISSVKGTIDFVKSIGIKAELKNDHTLTIRGESLKYHLVPFELGGLYRTATMMIGPLLVRFGKAMVPNPGGCRIGKRPINRHIEGLKVMGANIIYKNGYFVAKADKLHGAKYRFNLNTHTGTETMILAAVLAEGETVLENAAEEPEVDDLIRLLSIMGAKIKRIHRSIIIKGVKNLRGAEFTVMPDRNEVVTYAIAAIATGGDITVEGTQRKYLRSFFRQLDKSKAGWEPISTDKTRFFRSGKLCTTDIITSPYPGFMTDWQAPWALLMTQSEGVSTIHESIYEDRFGYIKELIKMGAKFDLYNPEIKNPKRFYNFNWSDRINNHYHAIRIYGPKALHNAIIEVSDLRAGATLIISSLVASGNSVITGIEHIDRGYEQIEERLNQLGAKIKRIKE